MIKIKNLHKSFNKDFSLDIIDLMFPSTGLFFICGESGCGKTTLLNILSGLDLEYAGDVFINSKRLKSMNVEDACEYRNSIISYISQKPIVFSEMSAESNLFCAIPQYFSQEKTENMVNKVLNNVDLQNVKNTKTKFLSSGEKQRLCLARCILENKKIILADEPTGNLDSSNSIKVMDILNELSEKSLVIVVTHDQELAKKYSTQYIFLKDGKIVKNEITKIGEKENKIYLKPNVLNKKFLNIYGKSINKKHRFRNFVISVVFSISFVSFACVGVIKSNISDALNGAFSNFFDTNEVIVKQKGLNDNQIYRYDSLEEANILQICDKFSALVSGYKYIYNNDFENMFSDLNDVRVVKTLESVVIPGFDMRSFNEFLSTDLIADSKYVINKDLANNEIIMSLNDKQIFEICFGLKIERNENSLFNYLKNNIVNISLNINNSKWGYDNEFMFTLKGFVKENKSFIYHSNKLFNKILFENEFQLQSTIYSEDDKVPWILKKVAVLEYFNEKSLIEFLKLTYKDPLLSNYYLNETNDNYYRKNYINIKGLRIFETAIYQKTTIGFKTQLINTLDKSVFKSYYFSSFGGYLTLGNQFTSGFVNPAFISNNLAKINYFNELYEKNGTNNLMKINSSQIIAGGISIETNKPLKIKIYENMNSLKEDYDSLIISSFINNKIFGGNGLGKKIYFSYVSDYQTQNNKLIPKFDILSFNVGKIIEENNNPIIYGDEYYSVVLFQHFFKMDFNKLNIKRLIIRLKDNDNVKNSLSLLKRSFKEYEFSSPYLSLNNDMKETLNFVEILMIVFAFLSSIITIILVFIILKSLVLSNVSDLGNLFYLGFPINVLDKPFKRNIFYIIFFAFISSIIFGFLISLLINKIVSDQFSTRLLISANISWVFPLFLFSIAVYFYSSHILKNSILKLDIPKIIKK